MDTFAGQFKYSPGNEGQIACDPSKIKHPVRGDEIVVKAEFITSLEQPLVLPKIEANEQLTDLKTSIDDCFQLLMDSSSKKELPGDVTSALYGGVSCDHCCMNFLCKEELLEHFIWSCLDFSPNHGSTATTSDKFPRAVNDKTSLPWIHECDVCLKPYRYSRNLAIHKMKVHEGKDPYACGICKQTFPAESKKLLHMLSHSGKEPLSCNTCKKKFALSKQLKLHQLVHSEDRPFCCNLCSLSFKSAFYLKSHQRHHSGEKYSCDLCEKSFGSLLARTSHMETHTGKRQFGCKLCEAKYYSNSSLKLHMTHKHGSERFVCDECWKVFSTKVKLRHHIFGHLDVKPYQCEICEKSFGYKHAKRDHMLCHSVENKPYKCEFCERRFRLKPALITHTRLHTGERPYACKLCDKKFTSTQSRATHFKSHSTQNKCEFCERIFSSKAKADEHKRRVHTGEKPYACKLCDLKFFSAEILRKHNIAHANGLLFNFRCELCSQRFHSQIELSRHGNQHLKKDKCAICGRMIHNMNQHIRRAHQN